MTNTPAAHNAVEQEPWQAVLDHYRGFIHRQAATYRSKLAAEEVRGTAMLTAWRLWNAQDGDERNVLARFPMTLRRELQREAWAAEDRIHVPTSHREQLWHDEDGELYVKAGRAEVNLPAARAAMSTVPFSTLRPDDADGDACDAEYVEREAVHELHADLVIEGAEQLVEQAMRDLTSIERAVTEVRWLDYDEHSDAEVAEILTQQSVKRFGEAQTFGTRWACRKRTTALAKMRLALGVNLEEEDSREASSVAA